MKNIKTIFGILLFGGLSLASCSLLGGQTNQQGSSGTNQNQNTQSNNNGNESAQSNEPIGTVDINDWSITVNSARNTKILGSGYSTKTTENNYVVINFTAKNNATSEQNFYTSKINFYQDDCKYNVASDGEWLYLNNGLSYMEEIGAKLKKTFEVAFETPREYNSSDYLSFFTTGIIQMK